MQEMAVLDEESPGDVPQIPPPDEDIWQVGGCPARSARPTTRAAPRLH